MRTADFDFELPDDRIALRAAEPRDAARLLEVRGRNIAKRAEGKLFAAQNLGIGKVAPEIVGKDVDGNEMKLSDYRGKVVVIDFWGDW